MRVMMLYEFCASLYEILSLSLSANFHKIDLKRVCLRVRAIWNLSKNSLKLFLRLDNAGCCAAYQYFYLQNTKVDIVLCKI